MSKRIGTIIGATAVALLLVAALLGLVGCERDVVEQTQAQGLWAQTFTFHTSVVTNANGTSADVRGFPLVDIQVQGITTATINWETTIDGTNWDAVRAMNTETGAIATTATADGQFWVPPGGKRQLRARISGYSGGTITVKGFGVTSPASVNMANVTLGAAATGTYIGDVELIASPTVTNITGAAAIDVDYAPGSAFWLESVTLNLSAAPTTSQNFTIVLDAGDGAAYDTTLYSGDLSVLGGGVTDLVYQPALEMLFESTDALDVDWTNSDGRTYGIRIVVRLAE